MSETRTAAHNAEVLAVVVKEAVSGEDGVDQPGDAFIFGFVTGIVLTEDAPQTAKELRQVIERIVARKVGLMPEQAEVHLRTMASLFDRTADEEAGS